MSGTHKNHLKYNQVYRNININVFHKAVNVITFYIILVRDWEARESFFRGLKRFGERFARLCPELSQNMICAIDGPGEHGKKIRVEYYFKHKVGLDKRELIGIYQGFCDGLIEFIMQNAPPEGLTIKKPAAKTAGMTRT